MSQRKVRIAVVALMLAVGGCYRAPHERYATGRRTGGPPAARTYGSRATLSAGVGASAGIFMPSDSSYADGLSSGMMWDVHATLWLTPNIAVKVDYGTCSMVDNGNPGEKMTASPLTASVLASVPMPMFYGGPGYGIGFSGAEDYRWLFGGGLGTVSLSYSDGSHEVPGSINVAYVTVGGEWLFGYGERFFAVSDIYFGELVRCQAHPSDTSDYWDFTSIVTLRAGIEIGF